MSIGGQRTKWHRNIAENFNRLSRAHERYRQTDRQTDRRETDKRQHIANVNVSSRLLKIIFKNSNYYYTNFKHICGGINQYTTPKH